MLQQDTDYLSLCALQFTSPHFYAYESAFETDCIAESVTALWF